MEQLKEFIQKHRPAAIVLGTPGLDAVHLERDVRSIVDGIHEFRPSVIFLDDEVAVLYSKSERAKKEFPDFPPLLHYCVSLGRRLLDPLIEFSGLASYTSNELVYLRLHPLQSNVPSDILTAYLERSLVNITAAVGIDFNRVLSHPHMHSILAFVPGLGYRRSYEMVQHLGELRVPFVRSRVQLSKLLSMHRSVYENCAGFIKIDTTGIPVTGKNRGGQLEDYPIDVLDRTRIHPENYEYARRMAADAIERVFFYCGCYVLTVA